MDFIATLKEQAQAETPLLLLECTFADGAIRRWATHAVSYEGDSYEARVLQHNLFEVQSMSEQGLDQIPRLSLSLANADAAMSQLDESKGFKGARLAARFVFFDLSTMTPSSDSLIVFRGYCNGPDEVSDRELRVSALNRMNMARVALPPVKIQRRCPWSFPGTPDERAAALSGPNSRFYACGYSASRAGGCGRTEAGGAPFTGCGYTREDCIARGMFNHDAVSSLAFSAQAGATSVTVTQDIAGVGNAIDIGGGPNPKSGFQHQEEIRTTWKSGNGPFQYGLERPLKYAHAAGEAAGRPTRRFGGIGFVPETIDVRPYGSPSFIKSPVQGAVARYNDQVPLVYGTAWVEPVITVLRNDGNLTRLEAILSLGRISSVKRVVVSDFEIPPAVAGRDMTGSGWYMLVTDGTPWGGFDLNFTDGQGNPQGDPYGSMAYLSVVVPNKINDGKSTPRVQVLLDGRLVETFDAAGTSRGFSFTNNTAWVLLDLLKLARWPLSEIDLPSFAQAAAFCEELIPATDNGGQPVDIPRFRCNLVLRSKRSAADVILGVRNNARLFFTYSNAGKLEARVESTLALQQAALPYGSNASAPIAGGWPAYIYSDTNGTIARQANGSSSLRVFHRSISDTPNRLAFEFQDEFNEYVQDAFAIDNVEDQSSTGQEVSQTLAVDGIPNFDQAARMAKFQLDKSVQGNTFVEFQTSVKAVGQQVGQIIALSYAREGWDHQLFRVLKIAPQRNCRTVGITAQIHDDAWYSDTNGQLGAAGKMPRQARRNPRPPNPLVGVLPRADGDMDWSIAERRVTDADGTGVVELEAGFAVPQNCFESAAGAPSADLNATVQASGGGIAGGQTLYYRVTALDAHGEESLPSFAIRAVVPQGSNINGVLLTGLRFDPAAENFRVYRGADPGKMFLISGDQPVAASFPDTGLPAQPVAVPDPYFDHADFYWKKRVTSEHTADICEPAGIGNSLLMLAPDQYAGQLVRIVQGTGVGQVRRIVTHSETTFQVTPRWTVAPEPGSVFHLEEPDWKLGSAASSSPARFRVPNQKGATMLIQGRAADEHGSESPQELAVATAWIIGGIGPGVNDSGTPPAPAFGISVPRDGTLVLTPPSFSLPNNVMSISALTFRVFYVDELNRVATSITSAGGIGAEETAMQALSVTGFQQGDFVLIGDEVVQLQEIDPLDDTRWTISRAEKGTQASGHDFGAKIERLTAKVFVYPVPPCFYFSADAAQWSAAIPLPCARLVTVEAMVTNVFGDSPNTANNYLVFDSDPGAVGSLPGLRTNGGGAPYQMGVVGMISVMSNPIAPIKVTADASVRDLYATCRLAPSADPVVIRVMRNGVEYYALSIGAGATESAVHSGADLPPLVAGDELNFEILSAGAGAWDLCITLRL